MGVSDPPSDNRRDNGEHRPTTAAGRLLALLGAFAHDEGALRLSDLSRRSGLSLTTTHRLIQELLAWEGVELTTSGHYRLSSKFLELASISTQGLRLRETALPYLVDLQRRTGLTVHLAAREGASVMNLEALRLHPNYGGVNRIGGRVQLHVGASGLVLLAHAAEDFIEAYLGEPLASYTPATITDPATLRATLATIREQGYAVCRDTPVADRAMVAAPVMNLDGEVEAAIGLICWLDRHDPDRYIEAVRTTAQRVSRAFAQRSPQPTARTLAFRQQLPSQ